MKRMTIVGLLVLVLVILTSCGSHDHVFAADKWEYDADYHWHGCTEQEDCAEQGDKSAHDFEVVINDAGKPINRCKVCSATNENVSTAPQHEHVFAEQISKNNNFHWYECTVSDCFETRSKAEHVYGNPDVTYTDSKIIITRACVDCAYENVEEQVVETEIDNAVSWDNLFKNFKLTNFTMDVHIVHPDGIQNNHCVVTEKAAHYCIPGEGGTEFYTVTNADGTCTTYMRNEENVFVKLSDTSDQYLVGTQTEAVLSVSFEDNFDKFVYDETTGSYVCKDVIEAISYDFSGEIAEAIYCYNNVVTVTDGKITSISSEYYFDPDELLEGEHKSFKYYNIGFSVMEIPQSVIDNAIEEN